MLRKNGARSLIGAGGFDSWVTSEANWGGVFDAKIAGDLATGEESVQVAQNAREIALMGGQIYSERSCQAPTVHVLCAFQAGIRGARGEQ
jgi:hypothetical protein